MRIEELLNLYFSDAKTRQIADTLKSLRTAHIHLRGLSGSSSACRLVAAAVKSRHLHLCILPDKEVAAYYLNDLENLYQKDNVLYFPASGKIPYHTEHNDNSSILLRAEVLNRLLQFENEKDKAQSLIVVTYPEAIAEKVVTRAHLSSNTLLVKKGEKLSVDFIVEMLQEYDFERTDYVIEPGQYSVRGGIIDVFSFSNDNPYRIELFGDEVESVRTFDTTSQLTQQFLEEIRIVPNVQTRLLHENRQGFFEYIGEETNLWIYDVEHTSDKISKEFSMAQQTYENLQSVVKQIPPSELYLNDEEFLAQISKFRTVEFGPRYYFSPTLELVFSTTPQPVFNKNFDLLMTHLNQQQEKGFTNFIFFDTHKQAERLRNIFNDLASNQDSLISGGGSWTGIKVTLHEGFIDSENKVACYTDHQIFERFHRYRVKNVSIKAKETITLKEIKGLNPGDYITHIDHGVGRYGGLEKIEVNGKVQESIRLVYRDNDVLYVSIHSLHRIAKYGSKDGATPKLDKLGSTAWQTLKQKTKKKVKEIAYDLIKLYAERKAKKGHAFAPDNYLQNELEASFIYEDTPDQIKATRDVKKDMEEEAPMDRLVCGDVGFGKTEIAIRAAFKAAVDGKQVAVLAPTTILTLQHYRTFSERLKGMPCKIDFINRFKTPKEQKDILQQLADGKIDILIGTHRIVGKDIKFKDLGLLIIDEEQKFGVGVKDKLKLLKADVDTLTLTATPIPRTLQFSMMGARDLSIMNTPPANRHPVQTEVCTFGDELIRDAILFEIERNGQVFFINNRVGTLIEIELLLKRLCPNVKVLTAHGQMEAAALEEAMVSFIDGDYDVLISTTIVESGLDIPNANTIIINDAHMFGLSDLHQLRGRVGRSNRQAFCYLLAPPQSVLTSEAQKRLRAISEFSDLGSGFQIAMRDLDIRGAGNLLGAEQSGFITEIGYEMYQKILNEAMQELREEPGNRVEGGPKQVTESETGLFITDCVIDTDLEILIPDSYVSNITERLSLYRELDEAKNESELIQFTEKLRDRFGVVPPQTIELINAVRMRWVAVKTGFEKLTLKNNKLTGHFISRHNSAYYQSPVFSSVLKYVQTHARTCRMKEQNNKLTLSFDHILSITQAIEVIGGIVS